MIDKRLPIYKLTKEKVLTMCSILATEKVNFLVCYDGEYDDYGNVNTLHGENEYMIMVEANDEQFYKLLNKLIYDGKLRLSIS